MTSRVALRAFLALAVFTVVTGLAYPLVVTGIAQLAFGDEADGSLVRVNGTPVGSRLIGQLWDGEEWFHGRPSAIDADASTSGGSNLGPTSDELAVTVRERIDAVLALERPYVPGLTADAVPADLVTASGSGLDPHISPEAAELQVARIAEVRGLSIGRVRALIGEATDSRFLVFGRPAVDVLELNVALDEESPR